MSDHTCPKCGRVFDSRRGLGVHHTRVHGTRLANRTCAECETDFHSPYEKKYCSETCLQRNVSYDGTNDPNYTGGKTRGMCNICGTDFEYYPSEKKGRYCPKCVRTKQWQQPPNVTGAEHPRWKGGKRVVE